MAKRDVDDLYGSGRGDPGAPGPLFAQTPSGRSALPGPFSRSAIEPSEDERWLADLLWKHQGRGHPVSIRQIIEQRFDYLGMRGSQPTVFQDREVKALVEKLRRDHRVPIGALKTKDGGYFIMRDLEDERAGMKGYLSQVFTSLKTWRAMLSREYLREMEGQIRMALEGKEE